MSKTVTYHYGEFPPKKLDWERLIPLIGPASAALARYDGILEAIPNAAILLTPLITQEAVLSSRIEGTQATMGEVFEFEAGGESSKIDPERKADIQEILNYRRAMRHSVKSLNTLPLCQRIIKDAHSVLMKGVRGKSKAPGEYRKIANWIGPPGCSIDEARFIPISSEKIPEAMSTWERYIHSDVPDRLVQLAILHVEFEALHPFLDGNGRLGRMFLPLFLYNMKILRTPMFYISAYFEANRDAYYDRLTAVSSQGDWTGWAMFFLKAITRQAEENKKKATAILDLYKSKKDKIAELTHSQYSIKTLDFLFTRPIFQTSMFVSESGIPEATAKRILKVLRDNEFFQVLEEGSGRRPAMMAFRKLINIAEGAEVL